MNLNPIPIIAIDGTVASGKGTIAYKLSQELGFHYLNSGALYRLAAYHALINGVDLSHKEAVVAAAESLTPLFRGKEVVHEGVDVWPLISSQEYGNHASVISPIPELRSALHAIQRDMVKLPGLVAEGRDMRREVFPDAVIKIFLDADIYVRAKRRLHDEERIKSGKTLEELVSELQARDHRDMTREHGKLEAYVEGGYIVDSSTLSVQETLEKILAICREKGVVA
jgi:cytidylate kinase